jgi:hypothetical protein
VIAEHGRGRSVHEHLFFLVAIGQKILKSVCFVGKSY